MEKMIAYCGLICTDCGAFIATQKNDNKMRKEVAEWRAKEFKHDFKAEDINCDGCISGGRAIGYCAVCSIKKCGKEKGVVNCGWCAEYHCNLLDEFFKTWPDSKKALDAIKLGKG